MLANCLRETRRIKASGHATDEHSYYPALADLYTAAGETISPAVKGIAESKNTGAGSVDFVLQVQDGSDDVRAFESIPEPDTP